MTTSVICDNQVKTVITSKETENTVLTENKVTQIIIKEEPTIIQHNCGAGSDGGDGTPHLQPQEFIVDPMTESTLTYTLPEIPKNGIVAATMNGVTVDYEITGGVNFKILNYQQGDISTTDSLKIIYFK